jgi:predicted negative regulator of RcsB-dependent stress response
MTHPLSEGEATAAGPRAESFVDWFHINSRLISIGAIIVVAIGFGVWFVQRTALNETISADKQLLTAKASLNSRNLPLAESDLKKVADKYPKRPAGIEAGLLLGQLKLEKGDFQGAVTELESLSGKVASGPGASAVRGLLGDAKAQLSKPADAAVEYEKAAALADGPNEKIFWRAKAARAYLDGGKAAEARKLFEGLAAQHDNEGAATEARVRLGELVVANKP